MDKTIMLIERPEQGFVLWLLGPTSGGKTSVAAYLTDELRKIGVPIIHYDGDEARNFFGNDFGFAGKDRLRVVKTLVHLANKSFAAGLNVIVSALTANNDARLYMENHVVSLIQVYIQCSIKTCMERDPKGLYARAAMEEITTLVGYGSEYLPPTNHDITIDTEKESISECSQKLLAFLRQRKLV